MPPPLVEGGSCGQGEAARHAPARGASRLQLGEITIHFDDPPESSKEALAAAKRLGVDPGLTPRQLDALRARGKELRRWLAKEPSRYEEFIRDPATASEVLSDEAPASRRRRAGGAMPRWKAAARAGEDSAAGAALREWALAEPGRLALLLKDPAAAVKAALPDRTPAATRRIVDAVKVRPKRARTSKPRARRKPQARKARK